MASRYNHSGPLTAIQRKALAMLCKGATNLSIAGRLGLTIPSLHYNVKAMESKMGVSTVRELVYAAGIAEGLRRAAELNDKGLIPAPADDVEEHINDCTRRLSAELEATARKLVP